MKTISSAEFRKTYPRLEEAVAVTANGHIIGRWTPTLFEVSVPYTVAQDGAMLVSPANIEQAIRATPMTQAKRDAILRKVNRQG